VFGQSTDIRLNVGDDRGDMRACGTPRVHIELSMQPVIVYLALSGCDGRSTALGDKSRRVAAALRGSQLPGAIHA
jgi:hypothetical protein